VENGFFTGPLECSGAGNKVLRPVIFIGHGNGRVQQRD
jgi:hypothetical protein